MPSRAILWIGALSFCCLVLASALALEAATGADSAAEGATVAAVQAALPAATPLAPSSATAAPPTPGAEPVLVELAALLNVVQYLDDTDGDAVPPAFAARVAALAARINAADERFSARLFAPDERLAAGRAERLRALFAQSGLEPGRLTLTGHPGGSASVEVVPAGALP